MHDQDKELKKGQKNYLKSIINDLKDDYSKVKEKVQEFSEEIFSDNEDRPGYKSKFENELNEATNIVAKITEKSDDLDELIDLYLEEAEDGSPSKKSELKTAYDEIKSYALEVESLKESFDQYNTTIFGDLDANKIGLKNRLEDLELDYKRKIKEWELNTKALFDKIEGLLPGATTTGLAKAYENQKRSYSNPYYLWSGIFVLSIGGMIFFAYHSFRETVSITDALIHLLERIPFFIPVIWLAIFSGKHQSQNRRLQEEYTYKEALAKSYESHKREIENLPDGEERDKLRHKLIDSIIDMNRYNPSETLQHNGHSEKPPIFPSVTDFMKIRKENK